MRLSSGVQNDLQVATLWDAYSRMKFDAATLATEDLPDLETLPAAAKAMLTCANVTYQGGPRSGQPIAPPVLYKTVTTADGRKVTIAIIGLLGDPLFPQISSPSSPPAKTPWRIDSPADALKRVMPEARRKAGIVVVLYAGQRNSARKLQVDTPGIDVMIVGLEGSVDQKAEVVGTGVLVQNSERGRYAGQLGITLDKDLHAQAFDLRSTTLDATFADDPAMMTLVKEYHAKLTRVSTAPLPVGPIVKSEWAGSYLCSSCHVVEFTQWKTTKHFQALNSLITKDAGGPSKRADCVGCHVVAFNKPGGYSLADTRWDLAAIGCEACHGPAAAHVDARLNNTADTSKLVAKPDKSQCIACHTKDNSPTFDFSTYRKKIVHMPAVPAT